MDLTIGNVSKRAGVNLQTVRYYERRGFIKPSTRTESGYRIYNEEAVKKIRFIKNAQALGFTLKEIAELLRLRISHRARCSDVKRRAEAKLRDVRSKMESLTAIERVLRDLIRTCHTQAPSNECLIIKSLEP